MANQPSNKQGKLTDKALKEFTTDANDLYKVLSSLSDAMERFNKLAKSTAKQFLGLSDELDKTELSALRTATGTRKIRTGKKKRSEVNEDDPGLFSDYNFGDVKGRLSTIASHLNSELSDYKINFNNKKNLAKFDKLKEDYRGTQSSLFREEHKDKGIADTLKDLVLDNFKKELNRVNIEKYFDTKRDAKGNLSDNDAKLREKALAKYADKLDPSKIFGNSKIGGLLSGAMKNPMMEGAVSKISGLLGNAGPWMKIIKILIDVIKFATKVMGKLAEQADKAIKEVADFIASNSGKVDSRLYGLIDEDGTANVNFVELVTDAINLAGNSPFVNSKELSKSIMDLANKGIAYNLEQKALWNVMTDKLVSTFDVTNSYLLRMIKLKQQELTGLYMGIEAAITRTLNGLFKDTQFLESQYDAVYEAMTDALSLVDIESGTMLGYTTEKWLGSLSSVGLDDAVVGNWAEALNALFSGNLNGIQDADRTLFAMAASRAGISYSDLLVNGVLDTLQLNDLLKSVVELLKNIYQSNDDNNVILSEWANLFGMKTADFVAVNNLSDELIKVLYEDNTTMQSINEEMAFIETLLVQQRTLTSERIDNVISNARFQLGWNIVSDADTYTNWIMADVRKEVMDTFGLEKLGKVRDFFVTWAKGLTAISNGVLDTLATMWSAGTIAKEAGAYALWYDSSVLDKVYAQVFNLSLKDEYGSSIPTFEMLKNGSYSATGGKIVLTPQDYHSNTASINQEVLTVEKLPELLTNEVGIAENEQQQTLEIGNSNDESVAEYDEYTLTDIYRALFIKKIPIKVMDVGMIGGVIGDITSGNIGDRVSYLINGEGAEAEGPGVDATLNEVTQ